MMISKIKNRHRLKNKEIKKIQDEIQKTFRSIIIDEKSNIEIGEIDGDKILLVDNLPCFQIIGEKLMITIFGINKYQPREKYVIVDMGAVKFVINGADIMAPGIIDADINIEINDPVWVCDEKHHKPLAVGIAEMNGEQMKNEQKGKAVVLVSYVGDRFWNSFAKSL